MNKGIPSIAPAILDPVMSFRGAPGIIVPELRQQPPIMPMEASVTQRIAAGQAITDLASAVKELIDNALDAGAQTINSKLRHAELDFFPSGVELTF
jgi:hypothetical protein